MGNKLFLVITFFMFFPVGCSLINDFSANLLRDVLRTEVNPDNIPANFPLVLVSTQNEAQGSTPSVNARLVRFSQLKQLNKLDVQGQYYFDPELLPLIRSSIAESEKINFNSSDTQTNSNSTEPVTIADQWRLRKVHVLETYSDGRIDIVVSAINQEGHVHTGWYNAKKIDDKDTKTSPWSPSHFLERTGGYPPQALTLPFSLLLTIVLYLWHLKRMSRMAQWQARMKKQEEQAALKDA